MTISNNVKHLKKHYQSIYKNKMSDIPIVNNKLEVAVVGFTDWDTSFGTASEIGILITPWFMNIVLLPKDTMHHKIRPGKRINILLADGEYSFLTQSDENFGTYLTCSLFSPMFEFKTQKQALETAEALMAQLLSSDEFKRAKKLEIAELEKINNDRIMGSSVSRRNFLRGRFK